jgi:DNA mismatch repair protein MutS
MGLAAALGRMYDLERLANRVGQGIALPRDLVALAATLRHIPTIRELTASLSPPVSLDLRASGSALASLAARLDSCDDVVSLIHQAIVDDPPATLADGGVIRPGFSTELDQLNASSSGARQWIAGLERRERERTGIRSLKVGYNKVFGYYIEVSNPNLGQVPPDYIRKQTLVGAERFVTPELKDYEALIVSAHERMVELEGIIYRQVCEQIAAQVPRLQQTATALAELDVYVSLAEVAVRHNYVRPTLTTGETIRIIGGRHPVVEQMLLDEPFVPNDCTLSNSDAQIIILTGPNMAGKSTYLRQIALIVLMAHM